MTRTPLLVLGVLTGLLGAAPAAWAQAYLGLAFGRGEIDARCGGNPPACDDSGNGGKFVAGYKFAPNWAGELSYFDFGKARRIGAMPSGAVKATAWGLGGAYFGEWSPKWLAVARAGIASTKADIDGSFGAASAADGGSRTRPYLGIGLSYVFAKGTTLDLGLDFTRIGYAAERVDVRLISLGLTVGF